MESTAFQQIAALKFRLFWLMIMHLCLFCLSAAGVYVCIVLDRPLLVAMNSCGATTNVACFCVLLRLVRKFP